MHHNNESQRLRVGNGFDSHRFEFGRRLILGGVEIAHSHGLSGHSDADVLTHAIIDSLLGAAGLEDIGQLFPPDKAQFKDISSLLLLEEVCKLLHQNGWTIINIDCVILAESPKLSPYKAKIIQSLANIMKIEVAQINIKAKTAEGIGALGRREGMVATAVSLLERQKCC